MDVYLEEIVMPRSFSKALLSITLSPVKAVPQWASSLSKSVVLPWSTWAVQQQTIVSRIQQASAACVQHLGEPCSPMIAKSLIFCGPG